MPARPDISVARMEISSKKRRKTKQVTIFGLHLEREGKYLQIKIRREGRNNGQDDRERRRRPVKPIRLIRRRRRKRKEKVTNLVSVEGWV